MKKPSEIYDELERLKTDQNKLINGRKIEKLDLGEQITLYGLLSKIEIVQFILME